MCGYLRSIFWTAVLATATAFAQSTPAPPAAPDNQTPEAPETVPVPKVKVRPAKPPKPPRIARSYAYAYSSEEGGSYLGVGVRDVTSETMSQLKLKDEHGVEVTSLDSEGPAAKAGIQEHDVILTFNGQNVEGYEQLRRMIRETPAGRSVKLGVSRAGQQMTMNVPLAKREEFHFAGPRPNIVIPDIKIPAMNFEWDTPGFTVLQITSRSGATVEDLTPQLGDYFGAKGGAGVLVRSVERGSPAEGAGLKAGDVIVKVGQERVANASEWRRMMRSQKGGPVGLTILRDRREQTLSIKLPERRSSDAAFHFDFPDTPAFNEEEVEKMLQRIQPQIDRASKAAVVSMKRTFELNQREFERQLDRSMRELERELKQQEKELEKQQDKE